MENNKFHLKVLSHLKIPSNRNFFLILLKIEKFLSLRQLRIVLLRYQGYKSKEIAKKFNLSPSTISIERKKIKSIMKKVLKNEL